MYDIAFISYNEVEADYNWQQLKQKYPYAKRTHGIEGIHQAHIKAAKKACTRMFYIVDADAVILSDFDFSYVPPKYELDHVHVWRSQNPINDLVYGYGGVKLLPTTLTCNMDTTTNDMTTSISNKFKVMNEVSNITAFDTDAFSTWRSAFRECAKLSSKSIRRQKDDETESRLKTWRTVGHDRQYGDYAMAGATAGMEFGLSRGSDLRLINDFEWLREQFDADV